MRSVAKAGAVVCILALTASTLLLYLKNRSNAAEVAQLRLEISEATARLNSTHLSEGGSSAGSDELERLRKEVGEIHKLRNTVQQLTREKAALEQQAKNLPEPTAKHRELFNPEAKELLARRNLEEGNAFLLENAQKPGVQSTGTGLQYLALQEGTGPRPASTNSVMVQYQGIFTDGTVFDSSYQRGQPATFPMRGVIKGWTEALQLMSVGSKYRLFIPAALAYGENGPRTIGPNRVLIFDVELLQIAK